MGGKIDLRIALGNLIKKLRRLDYFLEVNDVPEEAVESISKMLRISVSDCFIDLIIEEGKDSRPIAYTTLKTLGCKLRIPRYSQLSREDLVIAIKHQDSILGDFIEKGERYARGTRANESSRAR